MNDWVKIKFSDLCDITRGASPRPIVEWVSSSGIPWVKISDATSISSRYIYETREFIKISGKSKSVEVFPEDFILSNSATPGIPRILKIHACIHDGWLLLRNFRNIEKNFCYYLLLHERESLVQQGNGSIFTNLKTEILKNHYVNLPPLPEQRAIADVLGALDDKIELNRKMNATLESLAQAIFKHTFLDNPKRENWQKKTIGEVVTIVGGSTPSTVIPEYWENGTFHWATPKDLAPLQNPFLLKTNSLITNEGLQQISSGLLPIGTLLMSSRAPIGYLAIAEIPVAINQGFIAIKCSREIPNYFMLCWLKAKMDEIIGRANGTTFLEISKSNFRPMQIEVPPVDFVDKFVESVEPLYRKVVVNLQESETLAELRDTLLPKLMSGQVKVSYDK